MNKVNNLKKLVTIANKLDQLGLVEEVNTIEKVIKHYANAIALASKDLELNSEMSDIDPESTEIILEVLDPEEESSECHKCSKSSMKFNPRGMDSKVKNAALNAYDRIQKKALELKDLGSPSTETFKSGPIDIATPADTPMPPRGERPSPEIPPPEGAGKAARINVEVAFKLDRKYRGTFTMMTPDQQLQTLGKAKYVRWAIVDDAGNPLRKGFGTPVRARTLGEAVAEIVPSEYAQWPGYKLPSVQIL